MLNTNAEHDVVIVGYGPVGQTLAGLLARLGYSVAIVEKHRQRYRHARAGHIDHEILRIWQSLGAAPRILERLTPSAVYAMQGVDPDAYLEIVNPEPIGRSGFATDYFMYQPDVEDALTAIVEASPRVTLMRGWQAAGLSQDADGVTVTLAEHDPDGDPEPAREVRGRYVVGCDGANSAVRELSGIAREDLGFHERQLVVDFRIDDPAVKSALPQILQVADAKRPHLIGRELGPIHSRFEAVVLPGDDERHLMSDGGIFELMAPYGIAAHNTTIVRSHVYEFLSLLAAPWRDRRVLLAGDAAHLMPPFLGQGMCSGIRDAANLAWRLHLVLAGLAGDGLLDGYELERSPHVRSYIEASVAIGQIVNMVDPQSVVVRDAALKGGFVPPPPVMHLEDGLLMRAADGTPAPGVGELAVQGRLRDGEREGLHDDLFGSGWRLIARDGALADLDGDSAAVLERLEAGVTVLGAGGAADADGRTTAWLTELGATAALVRPDFYLYGSAADADGLAAMLRALDDAIPGPVAVPGAAGA
jgi:2-polyprenyl-6-methoxyphenol hydroxylase-like FAD-dependent oxidoreductase